jgi:hypothetical protein
MEAKGKDCPLEESYSEQQWPAPGSSVCHHRLWDLGEYEAILVIVLAAEWPLFLVIQNTKWHSFMIVINTL